MNNLSPIHPTPRYGEVHPVKISADYLRTLITLLVICQSNPCIDLND